MERLMMSMQRESQVQWTYEWPMTQKIKWHVQKLLARRKQQQLRRWLREVETLSDTKKVVYICEPESGESLSDEEEKRSVRDLINCQEARDEFQIFQEGNEMISMEDIIKYQEVSGY
jgi:hypothetical protein